LNLVAQSQPPIQTTTPLDDEEDEYEPDYQPTEDAEQIKNRLEMDAPEETKLKPSSESVGPYKLPKPPHMSSEQIHSLALATLDRMFDTLTKLLASQESQDQKRAFQEPVVRGAIDRNAYFRMIVRVAVRPVAGLETTEHYMKAESHVNGTSTTISDHVRQRLLQFILRDWQKRIGNAVTWFTEEWVTEQTIWREYGDFLSGDNGDNGQMRRIAPPRHYKKWVLRFLDDLSAYLGGSKIDMRILVRFVSEIPSLDAEIVNRVASLAEDPERVNIVAAALRYLIQYRPPAKEMCLDALQTVWQCKLYLRFINDAHELMSIDERSADGPNAKLLKALRPGFVESTLKQSDDLKMETGDLVCSF
jgi:symplekin